MHCLSAPRVLRKTSAADDECWSNISLLPETQARACGFSTQATLCKKHCDEKKQQNKLKCCFPLRDDEDCCGNLVSCPKRLFPVFDCFKNPNTGTFICEAHLKLADKDKRICGNESLHSAEKGKTFASVDSTLSRNVTLQQNHFVDVCDNLPRPHTHPHSHRFICLTSAQGHNQPTPRVQTLTGVNS